jgi:uncharacterized protein
MPDSPLYIAIKSFADTFHTVPERVLNSNSWAYDDYDGLRYAFLHTTLELRQLAATLNAMRLAAGIPLTRAQYALAQHQSAFRDLEALLIGLDAADYTRLPAAYEWPANVIVAHVHEVEGYFYGAILNTIRNPNPTPLGDPEIAALAGEPLVIPDNLPQADMWADFIRLHEKVAADLQSLTDAQLALSSPWWEAEPWPTVEFRLHRFDSHLREHTNQVEKVLGLLDRRPNESKLLLRQMFAALAEVEGLCICDEGLSSAVCAAEAQRIQERIASVQAILPQIQAMIIAVEAGDLPTITALTKDQPALAYTAMDDGISAIVYSQYRGRRPIVDALLASGMRLTLAEAAAVGDTERVKRIVGMWPAAVNQYAPDGYTPLQLACFFGHTEIAAYLVDQGADVCAVAHNPALIQPLHAAVAGHHTEIVRILIAHGANVNATQQDNFTPLMAARQNQDANIEALLLEAGATP